MKDFVSKLTFGFLMAQLFPGSLLVFAATFMWISLFGESQNSIPVIAQQASSYWTSPLGVALVLVAVGAGMAIHGLHWAVLGFLGEGFTDERGIWDETEDEIKAYGVGFRWLALQTKNVWVGLDLARGPEEDAFYIQLVHPW